MEMEAGIRGFGGGVIGALACLVSRRVFGTVGLWVVLVASGTAGIILASGWSLTDLTVNSGRLIKLGASSFGGTMLFGIRKAKSGFGKEAAGLHAPMSRYARENESAARIAAGEGLPAAALREVPAPRPEVKGEEITPRGVSWDASEPGRPGISSLDGRPPTTGSTTISEHTRQSSAGAWGDGAKGVGGEAQGRTGRGLGESGKPVRTESRGEAGQGSGQGSREGRQPAREGALGYTQITLGPEILYEVPPITLLSGGISSEVEKRKRKKDDKSLMARANLLVETLANFGVNVSLTDVKVGPAVTRFEVHPAKGVKVSQVSRLADDIALALAAPEIRVEAPIPGKSAIGIEVPNLETSLVRLRDVIESRAFAELKSPLRLALGKDIAGNPIVAGLDKMLHLLIAGATGSGKSVCINAIITSLLLATRPDEVKFLLIDPKVVELSVYNGIPHLISPVVTAPKKAASALRWVVNEMMRRYEAFGETGVRDIAGYNEWAKNQGPEKGKRLPYIVVVIDELSDLMMVSPVEVEDCIFRLAQMARAAGIHLVVATQRPSTDVITGTIKANIPSRIAFAVSSHVDSKTILDMVGAEKLIGGGDMLFLPVWATKPVRVQGAYVSDREVERVVAFASRQCRPQFEADVTSVQEEDTNSSVDDELFRKALAIVVEQGQASVSLLQRKLRIGYSRAGRLIDAMEERGYVGAYEGSKPRDVKITWEEYERLFGPKAQSGADIRSEEKTDVRSEARAKTDYRQSKT
ncbi:MAG TPA: DNA translocase FtsK [Clostridia bacterium]|nr:DNA translocase FtsK [Clostridia bacterium]